MHYDPKRTLSQLSFGKHDPCARWVDGAFWLAARTPDGPGSICLHPGAEAHGPGGDWLLARAEAISGYSDTAAGFDPQHSVVRRLVRDYPGFRMPTTRLVFPRVLRAICEQKVTGQEAYRSYSAIVRHFGEPAPGPSVGPAPGLLLPPDPAVLAATPYYAFRPLGLEQRRTNVLREAARRASTLERCPDSGTLAARLRAIPGIGPWTVAEVVRVAHGDADAVSVGDYHLKNVISWALAGRPRGTDEEMLELLAEFPGHRGRVCQLIEAAGITPPKYGPRTQIRKPILDAT